MLSDRGAFLNLGDGALHALRRTMLKFSLKCQVIPRSLFRRRVVCTETEPHGGGAYADVYRGLMSGRMIALKRLRAFQRSGGTQDQSWDVGQCF